MLSSSDATLDNQEQYQNATELPPRRLGFKAIRALDSHLIQMLDQYNLEVHKLEDNENYFLFSTVPGKSAQDNLPSLIEVQHSLKNGVVLNLQNLKNALEFLHQPIRCSVQCAVEHERNQEIQAAFNNVSDGIWTPEILGAELKTHLKEIHKLEHRETVQSALRFLTTGSVQIPIITTAKKEDHSTTEDQMRNEKSWKLNEEFGHKNNSILFDVRHPPIEKTKTIPCRIVVPKPVISGKAGPKALVRGMFVKIDIEFPTVPMAERNQFFTSLPSKGLLPGKLIRFVKNDQKLITRKVSVVDNIQVNGEEHIVIRLSGEGIQLGDWAVVSPVGNVNSNTTIKIRDAQNPNKEAVAFSALAGQKPGASIQEASRSTDNSKKNPPNEKRVSNKGEPTTTQ